MGWRKLFSHRGWIETEIGAGNGPSLSLKGFRTLSKRFFWNGGTVLQFTPDGIRPGIMSSKKNNIFLFIGIIFIFKEQYYITNYEQCV